MKAAAFYPNHDTYSGPHQHPGGLPVPDTIGTLRARVSWQQQVITTVTLFDT